MTRWVKAQPKWQNHGNTKTTSSAAETVSTRLLKPKLCQLKVSVVKRKTAILPSINVPGDAIASLSSKPNRSKEHQG
jgi:hypothetical protein